MDTDVLSAVTGLVLHTQLQLEAEGYPHGLVSIGIERARGMATHKARGIRPELYAQAYCDILALELSSVKDWVARTLTAVQTP